MLREQGFETCDSGDGVTKEQDACTLPYTHVFIQTDPERIAAETRRLQAVVGPEWIAEASYMSGGPALLSVTKRPPYSWHDLSSAEATKGDAPR
jgi:hypothetical protein